MRRQLPEEKQGDLACPRKWPPCGGGCPDGATFVRDEAAAGTVVMSDADFETFMGIVDSPEKPGLHPKLARIKAAHDAMIARKGGY